MAKDRYTYYATLVYPESAPNDWIELLKDLHIKALVSPLHDKDIDKDGKPKKPHYHIVLLFEALKSERQIQNIADTFGGIKVVPIHSLGAYSRYLCHTDDPDKAQYSRDDIIEICGADYMECCRTNDTGQQEKNLLKLTQLILDSNLIYFHEVVQKVIEEHEDWFHALTTNSYYIKAIVMSLATQKERKDKVYIS